MSLPIKNHFTLTLSQMRQLARYEITFKDIIEDIPLEQAVFICPEKYTFTLEDLYQALRNIKTADPTIGEFCDDWYYPLADLTEEFDLDRACGYLEDEDDTPEELKGYQHLMLSDSAFFSDIWEELDYMWTDYGNKDHVCELSILDGMISDLEHYYSNKGKPITEWNFKDWEMENYIRPFEKDNHIKNASEKELILCRKFIEELCAKENTRALHIKGYACYGGNRLYECNWSVSRDCMLKLYKLTDNPYYVNTLGYIFYYGRCTNGVPDYNQAFHYFGISAANGIYEGMYKLADMFCHGYGCEKSLSTARNLYGMVYEENLKNYLKGNSDKFADAALRMGNVYAQGIGERESAENAYYCYLQADYAAKQRAKRSDFFGDTTVVMNVQKALEKTKENLPEDYFKEYIDYRYPYVFENLCKENHRCQLTKHSLENGDVELKAERFATKADPDPADILITMGPLNLCQLTGSFTITAIQPQNIWFENNLDSVRYDFCNWNSQDETYDFYYDDKLTARIKCDTYRVYAPKNTAPSGEKYRFAGVCFQPNGRVYDYICDIDDVTIGDTVIVNGYDGETEVTVVNIHEKYESELGLPLERFKKVLSK